MALNEQQKRMVELYLSNGYNLKQAYETVYNKTPGAYNPSYPYQMIKLPTVKAYLDQRRKEIYESLNIDAERIAGELASIAFAPKGDEYYTAQAKLTALNTLSKNLGLQTQKVESKDTIEVTIDAGESE